MSLRKLLIVDDNESYPPISDQHADLVETRDSIRGPNAIEWSDYAVVFSHTRNDAADWADERFEEGVIDGLFVFSGGEDTVSEYLGVYTVPRPLFERRFDAFLKRYVEGQSIEECTKIFLSDSFDEPTSPSAGEEKFSDGPLPARVATFTRPDEKSPSWCAHSFSIQTEDSQDSDNGPLALNETLRQLEDLSEPHQIVLRDTYLYDADGLNLLLHLRLSHLQDYSRYPVLVRLEHSLKALLRRDLDFSVLLTEGTQISVNGEVEDSISKRPEPLDVDTHLRVLERLALSPKGLTGRHDLANEWGPVQLWYGINELSSSERERPKWIEQSFARLTSRRYYKYLFALSDLREVTSSASKGDVSVSSSSRRYQEWQDFLQHREAPLRLGLIDDEADKGWTSALNGIFADTERGGSVEAPYDKSDFQDLDALTRNVQQRNWDGLLVDLRLTESDSEAPSRRADQLSGVQLIKKLKKARPDLPIVAVTASNKAWTSKTLRSAGADGYWIKESPEYGVRTGYTIQNAADLITTLHETLQRYDNAAPIWALVRRIHQLKASRDRLEPFVSLTTEKDPYREVENRLSAIEQRLRRAFGYLVMKTSDHAEEEFAFNRLDLAFLTVWSVLNEVAALYFYDPAYQGRDLNKTNRKHEFRFLDPRDQSVTVYWEIENGQVKDASPSIPSSLESLLRPTTNEGKPQWPGRNKDNPRIQWLLHRAGASGLARRMHDDDFKKSEYDVRSSQRPPLRNLRNNLEEAHGEVQEVWHAKLRDVHDMVDIWNAILRV